MNGITHKQAQKYVRLDLDGLLTDDQRRDLEAHLSGCEACRLDAQAFSTLTSRLQSGFRSRWDAQDGPSKNVMATVRSQTRRIIMSTRVHWGLRTLGGIAVLFILGFGLNIVFSRLRDNSIAANETAIPDNNMPVSTQAEKRLLAFTKEVDGNLDIYTIRADGTGLTNLTGDSNGSNPYWSPDGKRIAFNRNEQVFIMNADGSNVVQLTDDTYGNKLVSFEEGRESDFNAWSPDGKKLVIVKLNNSQAEANNGKLMKLYALDVETKTQTPLTGDWGLYMSPAWSPDGLHIAFTSFTTNGQGEPTQISVQIVGLDGNNLVSSTEFLPEDEFSVFNYWSGDGQSVFFSTYKKSNETYTVYEARLDGSLIERSEASSTQFLDWWNGTTLTISSKGSTLNWLRSDGTQSMLDACPNGNPARDIASRRSSSANLFLGVQCSFGEWFLYLANEDGRVVQKLLDQPLSSGMGSMIDQAWSPDDNYIAFNISSQSGPVEMFILDVSRTLQDPTLQPVRIDVGDIFSFADSISWQPVIAEQHQVVEEKPASVGGDRLLAFTKEVDGNYEIFTIRADGTGLTNLTNSPEQEDNPYWSPDGKHIAFNGSIDGQQQIFMMDADGSNVDQLTEDGTYNKLVDFEDGREAGFDAWSPDGKKLIFIKFNLSSANDGKWMKLYILDVETKTQTPLMSDWGFYTSPAWSPDGMHVAFTSTSINEQGVPDHISIQVANVDGTSLVDLTESLPDDEFSSISLSYWARDGQSIILIADGVTSDMDKAYEARLDGSLIERAHVAGVLDWWKGTTFRKTNFTILDWFRADGTQSTMEVCGSRLYSRRSADGNLFFGVYCSGNSWTIYLANEDGSRVERLLKDPVSFVGGGLDAAWSPDGQFIAFSLSSQVRTELYILNVTDALSDPSIRPFSIDVGDVFTFANSPSWQPVLAEQDQVVDEKPTMQADGQWIAFEMIRNDNIDVYAIRPDGSALTNLTNNPGYDGRPVWSPDGKRLAFISQRDGYDNIYVMKLDGSELTRITNYPVSDTAPLWSPDGTKIAYQALDPNSWMTIFIVDSNGQNRRKLTNDIQGAVVPEAWSPDGRFIFTTVDYQIVKISLDTGKVTTLASAGDFTLSTDGSQIFHLVGCGENFAEFCNDVKTIYTDGTNEEIHSSMELQQVCSAPEVNNGLYYTTKWSPDRSKILFAFYCEKDGEKFYIANADGSNFRPLTAYPIPGSGGGFDWSPDSRSIVFISSFDGGDDGLYILNIDDVLQNPELRPTRLDHTVTNPFFLAWQPIPPKTVVDGKTTGVSTDIGLIAFTSAVENGNLDIYTMYPDGSALTNLTNDPAHDVNPYWSPDGKRIAFMSDRAGFMQIFVMNADGSDVIQLTNNEANHEFGVSDHGPWSPDGSRLLFTEWAASNEKWMLYTVDVNGENKTPIAEVPNIYTSPSWSPDGQHIAYIITETVEDREMARIHVVGADGRNDTNVTSQLPGDVDLSSLLYSWTQEGNIRFAANRVYVENDSLDYTLYEVTIDGATLAELAHTSTGPGDIWNGTTFVAGATTLNWLRPDGSYREYQPFEKCQMGTDPQYGSMYKRSSHGYLLFAANCPNGDWWFTWANPQGTQVQQLLDYPISTQQGITHMSWSSDDRYIAINLTSSDVTYLYVINVDAALKDPSTQPVKIPLAGGEQYYNISWQPIP